MLVLSAQLWTENQNYETDRMCGMKSRQYEAFEAEINVLTWLTHLSEWTFCEGQLFKKIPLPIEHEYRLMYE